MSQKEIDKAFKYLKKALKRTLLPTVVLDDEGNDVEGHYTFKKAFSWEFYFMGLIDGKYGFMHKESGDCLMLVLVGNKKEPNIILIPNDPKNPVDMGCF